jgi:hypothetical protein
MPFDLPTVTRNLLIANVVVFLLQQVMGETLLMYFALWPWGPDQVAQGADGLVSIGFRPWQVVTYAFMHGGALHLFSNMLALFMFGGQIERVWSAQFHVVLLRMPDRGRAGAADGGEVVYRRVLSHAGCLRRDFRHPVGVRHVVPAREDDVDLPADPYSRVAIRYRLRAL